jgi:hypothetical protein
MSDTYGGQIDEILEESTQIAGDIVQIDPHTWAIYGSIPVDGEVILAEFDRPESARLALDELAAAEIGSGARREL